MGFAYVVSEIIFCVLAAVALCGLILRYGFSGKRATLEFRYSQLVKELEQSRTELSLAGTSLTDCKEKKEEL